MTTNPMTSVLHESSLFLEGVAGSGKTTQAVERIKHLVEQGVHADEILLITPQRSYTLPYEEGLDAATWYRMGKATVGGLAQRMVALFWPLVIDTSSYSFDEEKEPTFLTYEVAQYFMAMLVSPLIEQGYFAELRLTKSRLYSQLLDNLNKAAVNCIPLDIVHEYLRSDSDDDAARRLMFDDIARTIRAYRDYTVQHNLLDFSLYNEVFWQLLKNESEVRDYMSRQFRHVVYDNSEEDFPLAHEVVNLWSSDLESLLVVYDVDGGYRKFMAANPRSARKLKESCKSNLLLESNRHTPSHLIALGQVLVEEIRREPSGRDMLEHDENDLRFHLFSDRLHHQMVERASQQVIQLVQEEGISAENIAVISPFLSDSLHYSLSSKLDEAGISHHTHRPSRVLQDEPITKILLTLATIAHPHWGLQRPSFEAITHMLNRVIEQLDLVRATLLSLRAYEESSESVGLREFERIPPDFRERISYRAGYRYDRLRSFLEEYNEGKELPVDHFFSKVFGEVLSQPGFGLHQDISAGMKVASVVESARKFRQAVAGVLGSEKKPVGKAYVEMVQEGVVSAFYEMDWSDVPDAILLTPVHTFLLRNRVYPYQIWLDVSNTSWHRRIPQPLTNPYILSQDWEKGRKWSATIEKYFETERLERVILGLIRRTSERIYAYRSELSATGQEQTGELFMTLGRTKRRYIATSFTINGEEA